MIYKGKSQTKMDDCLGYPYDIGNLHMMDFMAHIDPFELGSCLNSFHQHRFSWGSTGQPGTHLQRVDLMQFEQKKMILLGYPQ